MCWWNSALHILTALDICAISQHLDAVTGWRQTSWTESRQVRGGNIKAGLKHYGVPLHCFWMNRWVQWIDIFNQLPLLQRLHVSLDRADPTILICDFVIFRLDYCNVPHVGLPLKRKWKLQLVQNAAIQHLLNEERCEHIQILICIGCVFQASFMLLVLTFKAWDPHYLRGKYSLYQYLCQALSSDKVLLYLCHYKRWNSWSKRFAVQPPN